MLLHVTSEDAGPKGVLTVARTEVGGTVDDEQVGGTVDDEQVGGTVDDELAGSIEAVQRCTVPSEVFVQSGAS